MPRRLDKRWSGVVLGLCLLGLPDGLRADADDDGLEAAIEELFLGELVFPQEEGELQVTLGASVEDEETEAELALEWGLTDAWQVELEIEGAFEDGDNELGLIELGVRFAALDLGPNLHVGAGAALAWSPTESDEAPENAVFVEPTLILAKDWDEGQRYLFAQTSIEWVIDEGDLAPLIDGPEDALEWVVGGYVGTSWGGWTLEAAAERPLEGDERSTDWSLAAGVVFGLGEAWELGVGGVVGIEGEAEDAWLLQLTFEP